MNTISSLVAGLATAAALLCVILAGQWRRQPYLTGHLALSAAVALGSLLWPILGTPEAFLAIDSWQALMLALMGLQAGREAFASVDLPRRAWPVATSKVLAVAGACLVLGLMMRYGMPYPEAGRWGLRGLIPVDLACAGVLAEIRHGMNLYGLRPDPVVSDAMTGLAICYVLQAAALVYVESSLAVGFGIAWFASAVYVLTMLGICSACRGPR